MEKTIKILFIMLLVGTTLASSFFICKELKQDQEQEETFEQLIEIAEEPNFKCYKNTKKRKGEIVI